MDRKDVYEIGNDIMNAVNDAVGTGDFTGLNETLKNVTGAAAGSAADALYNLQGHLQDMAGNEKGKIQEMLKCADESLSLAVQAMNSAVVIELMDGGD